MSAAVPIGFGLPAGGVTHDRGVGRTVGLGRISWLEEGVHACPVTEDLLASAQHGSCHDSDPFQLLREIGLPGSTSGALARCPVHVSRYRGIVHHLSGPLPFGPALWHF